MECGGDAAALDLINVAASAPHLTAEQILQVIPGMTA